MLHRLTTRLYDNAYLLMSFMALCWAGKSRLRRDAWYLLQKPWPFAYSTWLRLGPGGSLRFPPACFFGYH